MVNNALGLVIDNYCKRNNILQYSLAPSRWLSRDWKKKLGLGDGVAFFYSVRGMFPRLVENAPLDVPTEMNLIKYEKANIRLESREGETTISFTELHAADNDYTNPILIENDFIALHTSEVELKSAYTGNFVPIISGYFNYILLTPIKPC